MADIDSAINVKHGTSNPGGLESMNSALIGTGGDWWSFIDGDEILLIASGTDQITLIGEPGPQNRDLNGVFNMVADDVVLIGPLKSAYWKDSGGFGRIVASTGGLVSAYIFRKATN